MSPRRYTDAETLLPSRGKEERKVKSVGHPFAAAGIEFRSVLLLPLAHAVAGCDTMSRLFVIGKGVPLRKLNTAPT